MNNEYSIVMATCADKVLVKKIAKMLVAQRLAACVQLFPIESVYFWQDEIHDEAEYMLFIKSKTILFEKISAAIKANHPYEVPEIIQIPLTDGLPEYLQWLGDCTSE